jgi:signal transduction histidine kinase
VGLLKGTLPLLIGRAPADQVHFQESLFLVLGMTGLTVAATIREKERALKFRDDFLSLASHELRTPMTALLLQTQRRRRRIKVQGADALTPELASDWITQDERQFKRLARLIDDMFDIARLNSGKLVLEKAPFELCAFVEESAARLQPLLEENGCQLSVHREEGLRIEGLWDASRLEQAIHNLLNNAGKYGAGKPVQVRIEKVGSCARISIQDQGMGIRHEDLERIFKPYERAVDENEVSGLGLGLHITKEILDAHQGRLSVQSTLGAGSVFMMDLPFVEN